MMFTQFVRSAKRGAAIAQNGVRGERSILRFKPATSGVLKARTSRTMSTSTPLSAKDITTSLLRIVSSKEQVDEYLQVYGTPGQTRTTVIKIGGEVIENELDTLVKSLIFLKEAGLFPVLVHGAGPQMNAELARSGIEPQYVGGNRVTDQATLAIAKKIFLRANRKLVDALLNAGVPAMPITDGVIEAKVKDFDVYGYVGEVSNISEESVESAILNGQIPVLSCLGESDAGQTLNINADVAARELAIKLQPHKTIFINSKGGWIEDDGTKLEKIIMARDYERMAARDYTGRQGTLLKLNEIHKLLQALPSSSSVALTSASSLSREILSSCSSGTVCVRGDVNPVVAPVEAKEHKSYRVGLIGARGYVGREMVRLIGTHPHLELVCASSRALVGQSVLEMAQAPPLNPHTNQPAVPIGRKTRLNVSSELKFCDLGLDDTPTSEFADDVDVWILALPNGYCERYATVLDGLCRKNKLIIDLSADQRFNESWVYGLPEAPGRRSLLRNATHIANPGCYATGAQLSLLPLLKETMAQNSMLDAAIPPHVFGVSGYSGAGTGPSKTNNLQVLTNNVVAYKSVNHIHENEVSHHLNTAVRFMPHVAPFFQGIHLTVAAQLHDTLSENQVHEMYQEYYANEPLVNVTSSIPMVKDNATHHHVTVGGFQIDPKTNRLVVIATMDNLLKGAATQAVQNINLALGLDEFLGISTTVE